MFTKVWRGKYILRMFYLLDNLSYMFQRNINNKDDSNTFKFAFTYFILYIIVLSVSMKEFRCKDISSRLPACIVKQFQLQFQVRQFYCYIRSFYFCSRTALMKIMKVSWTATRVSDSNYFFSIPNNVHI